MCRTLPQRQKSKKRGFL
ncbi:hypothetical protein G210_2489, partial [Candida maltosa Xu316]